MTASLLQLIEQVRIVKVKGFVSRNGQTDREAGRCFLVPRAWRQGRKRRCRASNFQHLVQIQVSLDSDSEFFKQLRRAILHRIGSYQSQMPAAQFGQAHARNGTDQCGQAGGGQRIAKNGPVACRSAMVGDDTTDGDSLSKSAKPATSGAILRPIPWAFTTRRTGA